ncbi:MAG: sensor histidine kinase [Candidatus Acidiferrales bacterium]
MGERFKRVLIAVALGLVVALACNRLDAEFARLGIPAESTFLNDLIVGLVAGLCAYGWASLLAERIRRQPLDEKLLHEGILRERMRIACEVHDTFAQGFAGMILNLEAARVCVGEHSETQQLCDRALRIGRESLADARSLLQVLRVGAQERQVENLSEAVKRLVELLTDGTRLRATCSVAEVSSLISADTETEILRIVKEAVNNVVKHAEASEVRVTLSANGDKIRFCVEDDGCGFVSPDPVPDATFGLTSMRERAKNLGGQLRLITHPGRGTRVIAFIPIPGPAAQGVNHGQYRNHSSRHRG